MAKGRKAKGSVNNNIEAYKNIKDILEKARVKSFKAVNAAMVQAYWSIGRIIVKEEQKGKAKAGYGEGLTTGSGL